MKKLLISILLILGFASSSYAIPSFNRQYAFTASGQSTGFSVIGLGIGYYRLTYATSGGTSSACTVSVEGSTDNSSWPTTIISATTCTSDGTVAITASGTANSYVRVNVSALTTTGTLTVNLMGYIDVATGTSGGSSVAGRVAYFDAPTTITGDADLTFATDTLTMTKGIASTDFRSPIVFGGTAATSTLTLKSTSGVGTTDAINLVIGNNGATTAIAINTGSITNNIKTLFPDGTAAAPSVARISDPALGLYFGTNTLNVAVAGAQAAQFNATTLFLVSNSAQLSFGASADVNLVRDAANVLALKNSTNAQEFRVYGTTTGPKYLTLQHNGSSAIAGTQADDALYFRINAADRWFIDISSGNYKFAPNSDNSIDIGGTSQRVRTGYFGTALAVGTNPATTGAVRLANNVNINYRNQANNANLGALRIDDSNNLSLGFSVDSSPGAIILNADSADMDIVLRSDTTANLFRVDAGVNSGAGAVSINDGGTATAGYTFYVAAGTSGLNGRLYAANLTTSAAAQTAYVCMDANGEFIEVAVANNCATSSRRFKDNINLFNASGLDIINKMQPVTFTYKNENFKPELADWTEHFGFIAEDVEKVDSRLVSYMNGQVRSVQYEMYTAVLTKAIQELNEKINKLERKIQ